MSAVHLAPDARLAIDTSRDTIVAVAEGLLWLANSDDEVSLMSGEQIALRAGDPVRAWNAGDESARVIVSRG